MSNTAQQIFNSLNAIAAALTWLESRNVSQEKAFELVELHRAGELTPDDIASELDLTENQLDATQAKIDAKSLAENNAKDELQEMADERGLAVSGTKLEIAERIVAHDADENGDEPADDNE